MQAENFVRPCTPSQAHRRTAPPVRAASALLTLCVALAGCGNVQSAQRPDAGAPIDAAVQIDAADPMVTLTVRTTGAGAGSVTSSPAGIDCGGTCTLQVPRGTGVTLTATPAAGASFGGWAGACSTGAAMCALTLDADTEVTASFGIAMHTVSVTIVGNGMAEVTSSPAGIDCPTTCSMMVPDGTAVSLTAMALDAGSQFLGWSAPGCTGAAACSLTISADTAISVAYGLNLSLVVTRTGAGSGTVTSDIGGIDCGTDCSQTYAANSTVTLTASPSTGSTFTGWTGGGCTGTAPCSVTITGATGVTATFALHTYTLTVASDGSGGGSVTSSPSGIDCGASCTAGYSYGTAVTLKALAAKGSTFTGWSGACTGTGACAVTLAADTTVHATFTAIPRMLSVGIRGTGSVASNPAGISCTANCAATFDNGTTVTLTATPAPGLAFDGWSGRCSGTGTCSVTLSADTSVTASFHGTAFTASGSWTCANNASCEDVYDVKLPAGATVTLTTSGVTAESAVRLAVFGPGVAPNGANLLTGRGFDRQCVARGGNDAVAFFTGAAGTYRIAIGRDWQLSSGGSGSYGLTVAADGGVTLLQQSLDDASTMAAGAQCGYTFTATGSWICPAGSTCQDLYEFTTVAPTTMTVAVSSVLGGSVTRLAVFDGGDAPNTTNRLNGNTADRRCAGPNQSDTATSATLPLGKHLVAVGRDAATSLPGGSGLYLLTITTPNAPLFAGGQISNDTATQLSSTTCP